MMRRFTSAAVLLIALLLAGPVLAEPAPKSETPQPCQAADEGSASGCAARAQGEAAPPAGDEVAVSSPSLLIYTPPPRRAASARIGGVERPGQRL